MNQYGVGSLSAHGGAYRYHPGRATRSGRPSPCPRAGWGLRRRRN